PVYSLTRRPVEHWLEHPPLVHEISADQVDRPSASAEGEPIVAPSDYLIGKTRNIRDGDGVDQAEFVQVESLDLDRVGRLAGKESSVNRGVRHDPAVRDRKNSSRISGQRINYMAFIRVDQLGARIEVNFEVKLGKSTWIVVGLHDAGSTYHEGIEVPSRVFIVRRVQCGSVGSPLERIVQIRAGIPSR